MSRWGLPYQGSKNFIAKWVVDNLPAEHTLVDLFAGGCAVTHCAMVSHKFERIIANDITDAPQIFLDAIHGEFAGFSFIPTREEFQFWKDKDTTISLIYSFGNNRRNYLYGKDIEHLKLTASRMVAGGSLYERRLFYKQFIYEFFEYLATNGTNKLENLQNLEGLERLQALERLQNETNMLHVFQCDYSFITPPKNSVVYADPPYRETAGYKDCDFDFAKFDEWLNSVDFPVIVSEYTQPPNCVELARKEKRKTLSATDNKTITMEKLFIQERFLEWYREEMNKGKLFSE